MPRPSRVHFSGAIFHFMSRGNGGQKIFLGDTDWQVFLDMLADVKRDSPFKLYAYCLMSNHFHLLMEMDRFTTSAIAQRLLTRYSHYFNARHLSSGHLFQGRYAAILCKKDSYLLELIRYIHLNPVRANLVATPIEWRWSGHAEYVGEQEPRLVDEKFPLSLFHPEPKQARALYEQFVADGIGLRIKAIESSGRFPAPSSEIQGQFNETLSETAAQSHKNLEGLAQKISLKMGIPLEMIRGESRSRSITPARHLLIRLSISQGFQSSEIASFLHCSPSAISKVLVRQRK